MMEWTPFSMRRSLWLFFRTGRWHRGTWMFPLLRDFHSAPIMDLLDRSQGRS